MKALELGRRFYEEVARPVIARENPEILALGALGRFGWGSECLMMDDAISQDHHWGPRIDILLPDDFIDENGEDAFRDIASAMPSEFMGYKLEAGHVGGPGLAPEGINSFLLRTIGRTEPPVSDDDWLAIPEEDIVHVTNGEVWHDAKGDFSRIRDAFAGYYPDPIWKRRMAHKCRYVSGMGIYATQRALLRNNLPYVHTSFGRTIKLTMELIFLLNRRYHPYDKWLYPMFAELPMLAPEVAPMILEACDAGRGWQERIAIVEDIHDCIDAEMVAMGLIPAHPKYKRSDTSGYRLLEVAYRELLRQLDPELIARCPQVEQVYFEGWVTEFVAAQTAPDWEGMLVLEEENED